MKSIYVPVSSLKFLGKVSQIDNIVKTIFLFFDLFRFQVLKTFFVIFVQICKGFYGILVPRVAMNRQLSCFEFLDDLMKSFDYSTLRLISNRRRYMFLARRLHLEISSHKIYQRMEKK
jgi:hypothetical protein